MNIPDSHWNWLFKVGGVAALLSAAFFPIQIVVYLLNPPPESIAGWFTLFQSNPLIGLIDLDILLVVDQVLAILVFLALFVALVKGNESFMTINLTLGLVSAVLFIAANPSIAMLSLSEQYAVAATEGEKTVLLAAGQTMIANWEGSAFQASYILGSIATIIISIVMLRSQVFNKATAYLGILANAIALGLYVPVIGIYISIFSVVFLWVWYILIGLRFFSIKKSAAALLQPAEAA